MISPPAARPAPRRATVRLRSVLVLLLLGAGVYAASLPAYLYWRVGEAARSLGRGTQGALALLQDHSRRNVRLDRAGELLTRAAAEPGARTPAALDRIRALSTRGSERAAPRPFAEAPGDLRVRLARADDLMSRVGNAQIEAIALLELGRLGEAVRRLRTADSLDAVTGRLLFEAEQIARLDLLQRERAVEAAAGGVALVWAAGGLVLMLGALLLVRRRVARPLADLEAGFARIADGDLTVRLPVCHDDEAGRLTDHFNEMTRVLRDRAEEQGRFAAAGELLAGVAHEVNNPLMAIAAHAEGRAADPATSPELREEMTQILRQARRASKLLRGLLRFVRVSERQVGAVNLNDVVRGALDLVSYRFGVDEIDVGGRLDPQLPPVQGDAIRLEQVLVNLLSNAIDALRQVRPPRRLMVDTWVANGRVHVAVADNGRGVPPEFLERLFRPFATTKGRRGTGLGLYISRQIVREAGGDLALTPEGGEGARFVLALPAAAGQILPAPVPVPVPAAAPPAAAAASSLRGVRVLLVDDEAPVRGPMVRFLRRRGAEVFEAGDGLEALERLHEYAADVIIADLRMPRMSGVELHAELQRARPALAERVLFLSGDISQLAAPGNTPVPRDRVLVKPVELAELERRIRECAQGERAGGVEGPVRC